MFEIFADISTPHVSYLLQDESKIMEVNTNVKDMAKESNSHLPKSPKKGVKRKSRNCKPNYEQPIPNQSIHSAINLVEKPR